MAETMDFSQYSLLEKKYQKIAKKQMELAKFLADYYGGTNVSLNIHLMFIIMVKHSNFSEFCAKKIPNSILIETEFANLFSSEVDSCVVNHNSN